MYFHEKNANKVEYFDKNYKKKQPSENEIYSFLLNMEK